MEDVQLISMKNATPETATTTEMILVTIIGLSVMLVGFGIQLRLHFLIKAKGDRGIDRMIRMHMVCKYNLALIRVF